MLEFIIVVYGCETWFAVREQLGIYEGRVLRKILGPARAEVTGGWRKLHNVEFHSCNSSANIMII